MFDSSAFLKDMLSSIFSYLFFSVREDREGSFALRSS